MDRLLDLDGYMPSQVYEILCAGRPLVVSPLRELADQKLAGVHVSSSGTDFIRACHQAVIPMTDEHPARNHPSSPWAELDSGV